MALFKAQAHARKLKEELKNRLSSLSISETLDAQGFPILKISASSENHFVKIAADENAGRVDGLGLPQRSYSPHVCTLIQEAAASASQVVARIQIIACLSGLGMKVVIKEGTGAGAETSFDDADAASAVVTAIRSDDINPLTISQ